MTRGRSYRICIRLLALAACVLPSPLFLSASAQLYDFAAQAPTGQTLYYQFINGGVGVVHPGWDEHNPWQGFDKPNGALAVPDSVYHEGRAYAVVELGYCCFLECNELHSLALPTTLRRIDRYAVAGCRGLRGCVVVPDGVEVVGNYAFCCSGMDAVLLPPSLREIGYSAFQDCLRLAWIEVPQRVGTIGKDAFLFVPSVVYRGTASGAPWGAAMLNGTATQASLSNFLPHITQHGGDGK